MIKVGYICSEPECLAWELVVLTGNQMFGGIRIRETKPVGWQIRTPKEGPAMAYCPAHASSGRRRS